jgi:hypothetical protein
MIDDTDVNSERSGPGGFLRRIGVYFSLASEPWTALPTWVAFIVVGFSTTQGSHVARHAPGRLGLT